MGGNTGSDSVTSFAYPGVAAEEPTDSYVRSTEEFLENKHRCHGNLDPPLLEPVAVETAKRRPVEKGAGSRQHQRLFDCLFVCV